MPVTANATDVADRSGFRQLAPLLGCVFIAMIGFGIALTVLPLYTERIHGLAGTSAGRVAFHVGVLTSVYALAQLVLGPAVGRLGDRIGRRPLVLFGLAGAGVSQVAFAFAGSLWWLYGLRVAGGIAASQQSNGRWRFNSQKYSDTGAHPATGRSGSAALSAEAFVDQHGVVTLAVSSYGAGNLSTPAGVLEKIQIKIYGANGRLLSTRNVSPLLPSNTYSAVLAGFPAGGVVQVQANVKGIDGRRMDVVTVSGIGAAFAPDLAVTNLLIPSRAITGAPTVLAANIAEIGGQHGARGDCVLYVDGLAVDRARGIWVDAGDMVSCAFTRVFAFPGSPVVRIAIDNVQPFDADLSNNSASAVLPVSAPQVGGAPSFFSGNVVSGTTISADTFETTWTAPDGSIFLQQLNGSKTTATQLSFFASGLISATLTFPLTRLEIAESGDGHLLTSLRFDALPASSVSPGATCAVQDNGAGAAVFLCAYTEGFSVISLLHMAGVVTYQSTEYSKFWNGSTYDENTYVVNATTATGTFASVQTTFSLNIQVTDGPTMYALNGIAAMGPQATSDIEPRQCFTGPITVPPTTYSATTCFATASVFNGFTGMLSGTGIATQP